MRHLTTAVALALAVAFTAIASWILIEAADASHTMKDGAGYRFQGSMLALGISWVEVPAELEAFRPPMTLEREGKWFGVYYPGFPALLAVGKWAGADWLVNPLMGGLLVLGTFLLGRELFDASTGLLAAGIVAASPYHLSLTTTYLSHTMCATLLLYAALAALGAIGRSRETAWAAGAIAGLLYGWAVATRPYTGVLAAPAIGLVLLVGLRRSRATGIPVAGAFAATALLIGLGLLVWNRTLTGDPLLSPYEVRWPQLGLGFHKIKPDPRFLPGETIDHYTPAVAWIATLRQLQQANAWFLPLAGATAFAAILPLVFYRAVGWRGAALAIFPLSLVVGYAFYPGTMGPSALGWGPRYYSEGLPALAILVARPITHVLSLNATVGRVLGPILIALFVVGGTGTVSKVMTVKRDLHADPLSGPNRRLERFLKGLPDERRIVFVDISTYHRSSALLVNRPDHQGRDLVAVYREPELNRAVLDANPGRLGYLVRWDVDTDAFSMQRYVPEEDEEGPPDRFPYKHSRPGRLRGRSAGEREP